MPRKAKRTLSGAPAAPARPPVDVPYGEGERRLESQRRMPVPETKGQAGAPPGPRPGGARSGGSPSDRFAMAMDAARSMAPPETIRGPTARPTEDLMTGAGGGPPGGRLGQMPMVNEALFELRALAQRYPYRDLLAFLDRVTREA